MTEHTEWYRGTEPQPWLSHASLDTMIGYWARDTPVRRWPRTRHGERERIPGFVRWLVLERDGFRCLACGTPVVSATAELDHIVPWSAGGPDLSENLRTLCGPCNYERSNFRGILDDWGAIRQPVTPKCISCTNFQESEDDASEIPMSDDQVMMAYCGTCGTVSRALTVMTF